MPNARPADRAVRENLMLIRLAGLDDAVARHEDRAGEVCEVGLLVLPGAAIVTHKMRVGAQLRVAVGGQHLAVGVDVDARPFGLLQ